MSKRSGQAVRGSTTGRPIMILLDVLGKRWTLRILWELASGGAGTFRDIQTRCGDISPTLLNTRLKELRELNFVSHSTSGYELTLHGETLVKHFVPLDAWANEWARSLD